jgi:outer membrane protein TolC
MRTTVFRTCLLGVTVAAFGTPMSVSAQIGGAEGLVQLAAQQPAAEGTVRRLTADEAVRLAAENNLGIQIARYNPQIQDLNVVQARAGWAPLFTSNFSTNSTQQPNLNVLTGSQGLRQSAERFTSDFGITQTLPWGGNYDVGWDSYRSVNNDSFATFSPQLGSTLALRYTQPLLRGFRIDNIRQNVLISEKNREIADVGLRETLATTSRTVRNAYWNLAFAIASLEVQQQSLALAEESLRNTRARVEIGTTPPIDIVGAEAEVAQRQEAVILAEAQIATSEDTLRALVYDPAMPEFWTIRIEPTDLPPFQPTNVDVDSAVRNALDRRTDLESSRKNLEANDVSLRFLRNQTLPDVNANLNYSARALGGTLLQRGLGPLGPGTGEIVNRTQRSFGAIITDLFASEYPNWTASLTVNYPLGTTQQQASLARARLQYTQTETQLRNQELQVATQVRQVARQVLTNQQRVQTTRASRELAEQRLDAEERKFAAGTSTSFLVVQAQRDLSQAFNNELRAVLDYNQSVVDLETVQEVPLR